MEKLSIHTTQREIITDITSEVARCISTARFSDGICMVFIPHTTAGVTINENADPAVKLDIADTLESLIPRSSHYRHLEGNSDSHLKASLIGSSVTIAVESGRLQLGTWQGIQFCEFDGPRSRQVWVTLLGS